MWKATFSLSVYITCLERQLLYPITSGNMFSASPYFMLLVLNHLGLGTCWWSLSKLDAIRMLLLVWWLGDVVFASVEKIVKSYGRWWNINIMSLLPFKSFPSSIHKQVLRFLQINYYLFKLLRISCKLAGVMYSLPIFVFISSYFLGISIAVGYYNIQLVRLVIDKNLLSL